MEISNIIGTDKTQKTIENIIETEENCSIFLSGPEGSGKSSIALALNDHAKNTDYCVVYLNGDENKKHESYNTLKLFVEKKHKTFNKTVKALKETIGIIPYLGKGIKAFIEDYDFTKQKIKNSIQDIYPFKNHLDFSLHIIGLHRKYKKIIIVCDNIDAFDTQTINYFSKLQEGFIQLKESFRVLFILISTNPEDYVSYLGYGRQYHIRLPELSKSQIKDAVRKWSGKNIKDEQINLIHSCSGGHLQLIKIISHYIKETTDYDILADESEFLKSIIDSRLKKLKDHYEKIKRLLFAISQSGENTTTFELFCLLGDEENIQGLVESAIKNDLLFIKDNYIHFSHRIVKDYITSIYNKQNNSFYTKLSYCLRKLTPADYVRRAQIETLAQHPDSANIHWALAAIQKMRLGSFNELKRIKKRITTLISYEDELEKALEQFEKCYSLSFRGLIDEAILELEQIPNSLPKEILSEKYYLICDNLAKKISKSPKEEVLRIISQWEEIKEEEPEIWYRFAQLKIISAAELGLIDLALKTETDIVKFFSSRLSFDVHAKSILERLNLFSEVLYTPEVAHIKMLQTEKWLTNELINEEFHKVIDLYISRTNLSSNCIVLDELDKSIKYAVNAISLTNEFKQVRFPSIEVPFSNLQHALILQDISNLPTVIKEYEKLYNLTDIDENRTLIDINYAGLLLLNNKLDDAFRILQTCSYIPDYKKDDSYYVYYYWCNFSLLAFLSGYHDEARMHIENLENIVGGISPFLNKYYFKHYTLLKDIIFNTHFKSYSEIKAYIENCAPIFSSKIWKRFKMAYLFTDMQIWLST